MEIDQELLEDEVREQDKALREATELIKWMARWVGEYKSKEAKEWLEKYGN